METRLRQEQKSSKQAKADRIVNSLKMKSCMLSPIPKKVKKKRRSRQTALNYLTYETQNGRKKKVCFVFSKSSGRNYVTKISVPKKQEESLLQKRDSMIDNSQGGYGDLFASVYENLKKNSRPMSRKREKASTEDKSLKINEQNKKTDGFVSIEYEPLDNYFYLVGKNPKEKMALFQNRGIRNKKSVLHNFVVNPVLLRSLKQDFQLERLFQ